LASWKWIWWHTILIDIVSTTKAITDNKSDEWEKKTRSHWIFYRVRRSACHFIVNESIYSTPTIQAGEPRGEVTARHFPIVETGITNKYSCWTIILIFEFRCFPLYNFLYTFLTFIFLTFSGSIGYVDRGERMLQWYRDGPYCGTRR
jgi:hypothetical protein